MNTVDIRAAYRRYAKIYDKVFGRAFKAGHEAVRTLAFSRGEKVLEIGVGTGLSLPMYPRDIHIVGIDLCVEMLDVARKRISLSMKNVSDNSVNKKPIVQKQAPQRHTPQRLPENKNDFQDKLMQLKAKFNA